MSVSALHRFQSRMLLQRTGLTALLVLLGLGITSVIALTAEPRFSLYDGYRFDSASYNYIVVVRHTNSTQGTRLKRATLDSKDPSKMWDNDIPVVFDQAYLDYGQRDVDVVKQMMNRISDHVCVTFHDVTNTWDPNNPSWFTQNGFKSDVYLLIEGGEACAAGNRPEAGPYPVKPCRGARIITEELLHALGVHHVQQGQSSRKFMTVNHDNILDKSRDTYVVKPFEGTLDIFFNPMSATMYGPKTWSNNGLETYTPIRADIFETVWPPPYTDDIAFYELSLVYECKIRYCEQSHIDCGQGYLTYSRGECKCVCPSEFDPENNCQTLINKASSSLTWPAIPMGILAAGYDNKCPTGFEPQTNWLSFSRDAVSSSNTDAIPLPLPTNGNTMYLPICNRKIQRNSDIDWESWPDGGVPCLIKPQGIPCGQCFQEQSVNFESKDLVQYNGSLGDVTVNGKWVTVKMCCRFKDIWGLFMDLPNHEPFRLLSQSFCSKVKGMREYKGDNLFAQNESNSVVNECYYLPPTYGCNRVINLNAQTRSVTISTPGFGLSREPNRRCLYSFQVPENARTRITFNTYDLYKEDQMLIKRYHKLQQPHPVDEYDWPYHFVSAYEYLTMEYWSSFHKTTNQGIEFTADVILAEESCYNVVLRGEDYAGDTSITETYEECLPWADTVDCTDFPTNETTVIRLLTSGNKCRNPDGELDQPWCYTYKNGTNCHKRYCDVCNIQPSFDKIKNCTAMISSTLRFCETALQRYGCFQSCGFTQQSTRRASCKPPTAIPSDGSYSGRFKPIYFEGEQVKLRCFAQNNYGQSDMICTKTGWTTLSYTCDDCPQDWLPYGDRCFKFFMERVLGIEAQSDCQKQGGSGTLFQIRNEKDQEMLHKLKKKLGGDYNAIFWISGSVDPNNLDQWRFTNNETLMTYFNWSPGRARHRLGKAEMNCIAMLAEWWKGEEGQWLAEECNQDKYRYVCQLNRATPGNARGNGSLKGNKGKVSDESADVSCQDKFGQKTCEEVLTFYPTFCQTDKLRVVAEMSCKKSCGYCNTKTRCREPHSKAYRRTSDSGMISPGESMTFSCNPGHNHISGNLIRACSVSGNLLGRAPVCESLVVTVDWNLNSVRKRLDTLSPNRLILLDHDGYRLPAEGYITKWYYYCAKPGTLLFLVIRRVGGMLTYVGHNSVTCEYRWPWSENIPIRDQIYVLKNDVVGILSSQADTLYASECDNAPYKLMPNPYFFANSMDQFIVDAYNVDEILAKEASGTYCAVPSIGAHIEPKGYDAEIKPKNYGGTNGCSDQFTNFKVIVLLNYIYLYSCMVS